MADKPIREQSAMELLETHAQALQEDRDLLRAFLLHWTYEGALQTFEDRARFRTEAQQLLAGDETAARCPVTWQPVKGGPVVPCTLPVGHDGKHLAPEPFAAEMAASPCDETGWLIEGQMEAMGQSYVGIVGGPHKNFAIVYDASRALRFSRREDAQAMVDNIAWFRNSPHQPLRVAEHLWQGVRPAVETAACQHDWDWSDAEGNQLCRKCGASKP